MVVNVFAFLLPKTKTLFFKMEAVTIQMIYALAVSASAIAAVLAWVAKIRWANEYKEAKEAQISNGKIWPLRRF